MYGAHCRKKQQHHVARFIVRIRTSVGKTAVLIDTLLPSMYTFQCCDDVIVLLYRAIDDHWSTHMTVQIDTHVVSYACKHCGTYHVHVKACIHLIEHVHVHVHVATCTCMYMYNVYILVIITSCTCTCIHVRT